MMTPKARAQLRCDYAQAQKHLAFLERCAVQDPAHPTPTILLATPDMIAVARQKVADLDRRLLDNAEQLDLFG
jgi:hypothetical protein